MILRALFCFSPTRELAFPPVFTIWIHRHALPTACSGGRSPADSMQAMHAFSLDPVCTPLHDVCAFSALLMTPCRRRRVDGTRKRTCVGRPTLRGGRDEGRVPVSDTVLRAERGETLQQDGTQPRHEPLACEVLHNARDLARHPLRHMKTLTFVAPPPGPPRS